MGFIGLARRGLYGLMFIVAVLELGISANLTNLFLSIHRSFYIYALVPPSITILVLLGLIAMGQPRIDLPLMLILSVLWLALGAWALDVIGYVQCDSLQGQTVYTSLGAIFSAENYCYQMKVIEALSWVDFCLTVIAFSVILLLTIGQAARGDEEVWGKDTDELELAGEPNQNPRGAQQYAQVGQAQQVGQYAQQYPPQAQYYGAPVIISQPGRQVMVQQTPNGPQVTQMPVQESRHHHHHSSSRSRR